MVIPRLPGSAGVANAFSHAVPASNVMKTPLNLPTIFNRAIPGLLAALSLEAAENLDRGLVALPRSDGQVYLGWRLLVSDPPDVAFQVARAEQAGGPWQILTKEPLKHACNFLDADPGGRTWYYRAEPTASQSSMRVSKPVRAVDHPGGFLRIPLQGNYRAQKVGLADFDGDGQLDYLVKQPDFNTDPYQQPGYWKKSEDTYKLEAYRHDGAFLWRYDMGWAIEEGIWYSPIVVYDLDGDGKAEVFCKAGEGDPREPTGHVRSGPEYLVVLDGLTGQVRRSASRGRAARGSTTTTTIPATCSASPTSTASARTSLSSAAPTRSSKLQAYDPLALAPVGMGSQRPLPNPTAARACTGCTRPTWTRTAATRWSSARR